MRVIVAFEKTEQIRHLGHLDLMRAMQRALRRSGLPIKYSQGFNPHVILSFASPLPVGASGAEELMDVALTEAVGEDVFAAQLRGALPESLPLVSIRTIDDKHPALMASLTCAAYMATLPKDADAAAMVQGIPTFLENVEIMAMRRTKSGETLCDIRPMILSLSGEVRPDDVLLTFTTSLTERATLRPDLLLRTLAEHAGAELPPYHLRRQRLFAQSGAEQLVPLMEY